MKMVHGWAYPDADEFMANEMKEDGSYQAGHLRAALGYVKDWSIAIDGGAHVGTWSKVLSRKFERVIAVEPSPDTHEALVANLEAFGCSNVETKAVAIGQAPGFASMVLERRAAERKNTGGRQVRQGGSIPIETIDSWELPSLGLLKLDVEGYEASALRGAMQTLKRCRPIVIFEEKGFGRSHGELPNAAADVLRKAGYYHLKSVKMDHIWGAPAR